MRSVPALAAVGVLLVGLAGCGGDSAGTDGQRLVNGKTFTMVLSADPGNLDPHFTSLASTQQVDRFLYDSLLNVGPDGTLVAGLAEKWQGDTTTVTYTLRKGVSCADGSPLTAGQVAANITFVGDPKNASSRIGVFVPAGATATADEAAGTVTVTSPTPAAFLDRMVGGLHIVCDRGLKDRKLLRQGSVGTGMFTLTEAVADDHYTLTRRKEYAWGPGDWPATQDGLPDTVVLKVVTNESTAANLVGSDQANAVTVIGPDSQRLRAMRLFERSVVAALGELWFHQKPGLPGADETVRRALTQALDLKQLGQVVSSGTGKPMTGLVAPGLNPCPPAGTEALLPAHDPAAAKAALDAAGWLPGGDGVRVKDGRRLAVGFYYPTNAGSGMQAGAELLQRAWQAVGAQVTIRGVANAEISQVIVGGQGSWDAAFLPLNVGLPSELVPFFSGATPPDGVNFAHVGNPEYAAAVGAASAMAGTGGCARWAEAEQALVRAVDIVPFVYSTVPVFGKGASFELSSGSVAPSSIRMLG
ncbi:ABC transporter substrate-binding protein [Plantactinospora veratri]|uniref:ABC transporter substrate-binding protein n=1 Tax=Plantactinospora veratri TaxID=1436122 RepID=A0ABU7SMK1_9ACTN